jgi:hypothetical protein
MAKTKSKKEKKHEHFYKEDGFSMYGTFIYKCKCGDILEFSDRIYTNRKYNKI